MRQYLDLVQRVLDEGVDRPDRTGVGRRSVFGHQMRFDLSKGFPLVTTKETHFRSIVYELLWFIRGDTNIKYLKDNGVSIWDEWADEKGELGPVYGKQWRSWKNYGDKPPIDQLQKVIDRIIKYPDSTRNLVSAWNTAEVDEMAIPPCHTLFQFYVANGKLSSQLYQRTVDVFLGFPFNIASYALLDMMIAQIAGLQPGEFVHTSGDAHLYLNHLEQAKVLVTREPRELPTVKLNPNIKNINDFRYEDFELKGYDPHPKIKAPIAV